MGAAASAAQKAVSGDGKKGDKGGKPGNNQRKQSALIHRPSVVVPRLKRAMTDDKAVMFGVALDFGGGKSKTKIPNGCTKCTCSAPIDCSSIATHDKLHLHEIFQEEVKNLRTYSAVTKRSTNTAHGARYMGEWFHPESASEAPENVRTRKPLFKDGSWAEPWHVTAWVHFEDPYTHKRCRFRLWRRVEQTELKPKVETSTVNNIASATPQTAASPETEPNDSLSR